MVKYSLLIFIFICSFNLHAQDGRILKKAEAALESGEYAQALEYFEQLLGKSPEDAELNHKTALCHLNMSSNKKLLYYANNAVKYAEKPTLDMYFTLARAYHLDHQFDKAIEAYKNSDPGNKNKKAISKYIKECQYGKSYVSNAEKIKITNAGKSINTEHPEYLPYITADLSRLYFTSRRPGSTGGKKAPDGMYYEDIYTSVNRGGAWEAPENVGPPLNGDGHDACIGISADGQTMFIYKGSNGGDIYTSELKGKKWSNPKPIEEVNSPFFESSACVSPDGRMLFFVRAADYKSNKDIYMCSKTVKGNWSKPRKLPFNTEYDEDAPFMHPDGKTLYFSSKGHSSMGEYDVFKVTLKPDGSWTKPENLGYPINTAGNDVFFVLAADAKIGLYSSDREGGLGKQDIYTIRMPVKDKGPELALLKGKVKDAETGKPLEAEITITDNSSRELLAEFHSNQSSGNYLVSLPSGKNYNVTVEKDGYVFYSENINFNPKDGYKEMYRDIDLMPLKSGSKVVLKNIFFNTGEDVLSSESITELQRLARLLLENRQIRIEISGHTDNTGNNDINKQLSEKRAKAVYDYLVENGVPANRMTYQGFGSSQPIDTNETEEGRQNNRRTEFKVL
ncbi:OmpA family protein [Cytophagaceae bacterium ABcell3]|nr:OmpA family protein [Cytophagaceae bacterium ABcell3]